MARPKRTSVRSQLILHQKHCEVITIRREPLDPFSLGVFVVDIGTDLVLVNDVTDLSRDGYKVLRIRDISRIERGGSEKVVEKILRSEGIVTEIAAPFEIDLSNWRSAIAAIKAQSRNIIIEDENPDDDLFLIGRVTRLSSETVSIRPFDPLARWELSDRVIPCSRITAVTFDDRYTILYSKYVREPK